MRYYKNCILENRMCINLFFVRHGMTEYNKNVIIQGQTDRSNIIDICDKPLLPNGYTQAETLVKIIIERNLKPQIILSSPLLRAYQTAQILSKKLGLDVIKNDGLKEMFFGAENEGMPVSEFKKKIFNPALKFVNPLDYTEYYVKTGKELREYHKDTNPKYDLLSHPNGETKKEVRDRAKQAIRNFVLVNPTYKNILIPTHNALLRFLMGELDVNSAQNTVGHEEIVYIQYDINKNSWKLIERYMN